MGFRFNRRIKLLPGVTLNVSKSGLSTSFGPKGAKVTLGHGKTRTTFGLPGTGLSHSTLSSNKKTVGQDNFQDHAFDVDTEQQSTGASGYTVGKAIAKGFRLILKAAVVVVVLLIGVVLVARMVLTPG